MAKKEENFQKILEAIKDETEGVQLAVLAEKVGRCRSAVYYQVLELERLGLVRVRRGRNLMLIHPVR